MSTQYRLVQSGETASGGCSAGPRFVRAVAPRIYFTFFIFYRHFAHMILGNQVVSHTFRDTAPRDCPKTLPWQHLQLITTSNENALSFLY